MRARHVLGDEPADPAQRLAAPFLRRRSRADVLLGDASLRPAAGQRVEVDPELLRDPPHEWSRLRGPGLWL